MSVFLKTLCRIRPRSRNRLVCLSPFIERTKRQPLHKGIFIKYMGNVNRINVRDITQYLRWLLIKYMPLLVFSSRFGGLHLSHSFQHSPTKYFQFLAFQQQITRILMQGLELLKI